MVNSKDDKSLAQSGVGSTGSRVGETAPAQEERRLNAANVVTLAAQNVELGAERMKTVRAFAEVWRARVGQEGLEGSRGRTG